MTSDRASVFLERLNDLLIEDLLETSDDEIWREAIEEYGSEEAALLEVERMRKKINKILKAAEKCQHDWEDQGRIRDGYSRGHGIVAYGYKCRKCGETMEIEKDIL